MEEVEEQPMSSGLMFTIVVILIIFFIATITVVAVSVSQSVANLPADIDIVIIDSSKGILLPQTISIDQHLGFRRNIYVLTDSKTNGPASIGGISNVFYVV